VAAASAVDASALALPVTPDGGDPDGGLIIKVWLIALLAPLIALILVVLVGRSSILPRDGGRGRRKYGYGRLTNLQCPLDFCRSPERPPGKRRLARPWGISWPARARSVPFYERSTDLP
jgi:hypothetical protein